VRPPDTADVIEIPVGSPVAEGWGVADNAISTFPVPVRPDIGVVRIGSFIAAREIPRPGFVGFGNDRTFDSNFDANRTKLTLELNFRTGEGTAWATPSCAYASSLIPDGRQPSDPVTLCHGALPLDGSGSGSQLLVGSREAEDVVEFRVTYSAKQSFLEGVPGLRTFVTKITGDLVVLLGADDSVCLTGRIDAYPSVESYLYPPSGGVVTIYQTSESALGPELGLSSVGEQKSVRACPDRV
jgi:hypothetical protein